MDNLVIDSQLMTIIIDDKNANAAAAMVESIDKTLPEVALIEDRQTLLDIASLSHGDDAAIVTNIENTVLLEDGTLHILDDDGWRRVRDKAGLFMELLGEEVDAEVAVLTGLGRRGDADDLARAALEDQEVTDADVVAGDGDCVGMHGAMSIVMDCVRMFVVTTRIVRLANDHFLAVDYFTAVAMMVMTAVKWMDYAISGALQTAAEAMVLPFVVVVSHIRATLAVNGFPSSLLYSDLFAWEARRINSGSDLFCANFGAWVVVMSVRRVNGGASGLFDIDLFESASGLSHEWPCGLAITPFSLVKDRVVPSSRTANYALFGESLVLDVDLGVDVPLVGFTVAVNEMLASALRSEDIDRPLLGQQTPQYKLWISPSVKRGY
jgi:hypothetical protein